MWPGELAPSDELPSERKAHGLEDKLRGKRIHKTERRHRSLSPRRLHVTSDMDVREMSRRSWLRYMRMVPSFRTASLQDVGPVPASFNAHARSRRRLASSKSKQQQMRRQSSAARKRCRVDGGSRGWTEPAMIKGHIRLCRRKGEDDQLNWQRSRRSMSRAEGKSDERPPKDEPVLPVAPFEKLEDTLGCRLDRGVVLRHAEDVGFEEDLSRRGPFQP